MQEKLEKLLCLTYISLPYFSLITSLIITAEKKNSITTWTRRGVRGEGGQKMAKFCPSSC